jgi:hypothetical protein
MEKCESILRSGKQCTFKARKGSKYCGHHDPAEKDVRVAASKKALGIRYGEGSSTALDGCHPTAPHPTKDVGCQTVLADCTRLYEERIALLETLLEMPTEAELRQKNEELERQIREKTVEAPCEAVEREITEEPPFEAVEEEKTVEAPFEAVEREKTKEAPFEAVEREKTKEAPFEAVERKMTKLWQKSEELERRIREGRTFVFDRTQLDIDRLARMEAQIEARVEARVEGRVEARMEARMGALMGRVEDSLASLQSSPLIWRYPRSFPGTVLSSPLSGSGSEGLAINVDSTPIPTGRETDSPPRAGTVQKEDLTPILADDSMMLAVAQWVGSYSVVQWTVHLVDYGFFWPVYSGRWAYRRTMRILG